MWRSESDLNAQAQDVRRLLSGEVLYQLDYHSKWRFQSDLNG